ncbi:MAG: hypothetical protein RL684_452 [Pseudomonadota bacterium]
MQLLVDSTGVKFLGESEWKRKKNGAEYRREWRKVHLGIGAQALEIRVVEVTSNAIGDAIGDAPMLPELLAQIAPDEAIASVTADCAYDTRACRDVIALRGGAGGDSPAPQRQPVEPAQPGRRVSQRSGPCVRQTGPTPLEDVERLPPAQPGGDQDARLQAPGRVGHGAHL